MLTLRHVTLRYVRVENRHKTTVLSREQKTTTAKRRKRRRRRSVCVYAC